MSVLFLKSVALNSIIHPINKALKTQCFQGFSWSECNIALSSASAAAE